MSTQYYNTLRSTKPLSQRTENQRSFSKSQSNLGGAKRERLKRLIQEKIMKKYNLTSSKDFIDEEINTFIACENLNDKDLKLLDNRINTILKEKGMITTSKSVDKKSTICVSKTSDLPLINNSNEEREKNVKIENSRKERDIMSGASNLSTMFKKENQGNKKRNDPEVPEEDLINPKKRSHRFEFEHEDDMWNAFNNVNRRIFEQERIDEKQKDMEIKRRTKEDLDNQIKQKLLRLENERVKESEYHTILVKHIDHLNLLEEQKQAKIKDKIIKEKENRDKQMWDQNYRKKVEKIKNRKYENQLLNYISSEIQSDKEFQNKKKLEAKEQLRKTLEENENIRLKKEMLKQEEADDEMKCAEEYNNILKKQEQDRANYFKNIELKSTDFMAKMTDTVLKDLKEKNAQAEKRMNEFLKKQEEEAVQQEKNDLIKKYQNKKEMKKFLDYQVAEKKRLAMFEKEIDEDQAMVIKKDFELYEEYKKDASQKVNF